MYIYITRCYHEIIKVTIIVRVLIKKIGSSAKI